MLPVKVPPATGPALGVGTASLKSLGLLSVSAPEAVRCALVLLVRFTPVLAPSKVVAAVPYPTASTMGAAAPARSPWVA